MWQSIKIILVFAFVGPPIIGTIACTAPIAALAVQDLSDSLQFLLPELASCALEGPLFGFIAGFVPAAFTGAVLAIIFASPNRQHLTVVSVLSAALTLVVAGFIAYASELDEIYIFTAAATVAGFIAGNLCWRLATWRRKPTSVEQDASP